MNAKADALADLGSDAAAASIAFRNKIINGAMDIWQRGTSFALASSTVTYTADRWCALRAATGSTISRVSGSVARYGLKLARDNGNSSTSPIYLSQVLETAEAVPLAGKTVTLSAVIKAGANFSAANLGIKIRTGTGTDEGLTTAGAFTTGDAATLDTTQVITTTATKYSWTVAIPSGKTGIAVQFVHTPVGTAGADDTVTIENVQLEAGEAASAFEHRHIGAEQALCERYYETGSFGFTGYTVSGNAISVYPGFRVRKRATPTMSCTATANVFTSGTAVGQVDDTCFSASANWTASTNGVFTGTYTADAEL